MLRIGADARNRSNLLRGQPRDEALVMGEWLEEGDRDNIQAWLAVHGSPSDFFDSLSEAEQHTLVETLMLDGGDTLPSLCLQADEAHQSMWGLVLTDLSICGPGHGNPTKTSWTSSATSMTTIINPCRGQPLRRRPVPNLHCRRPRARPRLHRGHPRGKGKCARHM